VWISYVFAAYPARMGVEHLRITRWINQGAGGWFVAPQAVSTTAPSCPQFCPQIWGQLYPSSPEGVGTLRPSEGHPCG